MDTSEQYIKMCDCPEIRKEYKRIHDIGDGRKTWDDKDFVKWDDKWDNRHMIWLPRQDQIQEILIKEKFGTFDANWDISVDIPIQFVAKNPTLELSSMEQIWLSCYMLSIYDKLWDGEKWVVG